MTTTNTAPSPGTQQLTCPIPVCKKVITAARVVTEDSRCPIGIDAEAAFAHVAEHTTEEAAWSDLIPTHFHCGLPWEHEAHAYGYGWGDDDWWVCPGINWQEGAPR